MLWIPSTDSLHGLSVQLHALAALTRGAVAVLLESRVDVTQRQSWLLEETNIPPPPHRNQTKLLRSSNHPMGGAPHSTARKVQWLARRPKTSRTRIINSYYYWFLSYLRSRVKCQEFFMVVHVFLHDHISVHCSKSNRYCPLELMNRLVQKHSEAVGPLYHQKPWSKMTLHSSFNKWVLHNRAGKGGERDADW